MSQAEPSPFPIHPQLPELWAESVVLYLGTSGDRAIYWELAEALRHAERLYRLPPAAVALVERLEREVLDDV